MNSITQLLDLFKSLQTYLVVFSTQLEHLILVKKVLESISSRLNSVEFINLIDDCSRSIHRISDFINVIHPVLAKKMKSLFT